MNPRRRKSRFNKQQWLVERERFQVDSETPVPTTDNTTRIDQPLERIVKSLGINLNSTLHRLMDHWDTIAGATLSRYIRPGPLENNVLIVYCTNSVILSELSRFQGKMLLENIQKQVGKNDVRRLRFLIDPDTR